MYALQIINNYEEIIEVLDSDVKPCFGKLSKVVDETFFRYPVMKA